MRAGIVGLPNVGKSTLFNALTSSTGAPAENYPFCTIEPNVGVVPVPDSRLAVIRRHIQTQEVIPAALELVDIAGLVRGASVGEGLGNKFLSHIREVDAVLQVVRCFADPNVAHVDGDVDPLRDIETIETELMLADLQQVETSLDKASRVARTGDKDAKVRSEILSACRDALAAGRPLRDLTFHDPERARLLRGMGLLSAKKVLYVANIDEDNPDGTGEAVDAVCAYAAAHAGEVVCVQARIEAELAELDPDDREEMLHSLGMNEPALDKVVHAAYRLLGLRSFFSANPNAIRAWTIPIGATAPQAAGVIHTDFERGFIRCETYSVHDLEDLRSESAIRAAGRMRIEGRDYTVQDGDVCHFLFQA